MTFSFGLTSLRRLEGVHPILIETAKLAISKSKVDFSVLEGVRSRATMMEYWGCGRTVAECKAKGIPAKFAKPQLAKVTWLKDPFNSKHGIQKDGYGHAIDLIPYPVDWEGPSKYPKFDAIAKAMLDAADELGHHVRWGADWDEDGNPRERGESDSPHFEI